MEGEFTKVRERYARYKRELIKKERSGTSLSSVAKAKKRSEELKFLKWLDEFTKPRKSVTNIVDLSQSTSSKDGESDSEYQDTVREIYEDDLLGDDSLLDQMTCKK